MLHHTVLRVIAKLLIPVIMLFALYVPRWFGDIPGIGRIPPFGLRSWKGYILPLLRSWAFRIAMSVKER